MILLAELLIAALVVAVLAAIFSAGFWVLMIGLAVWAIFGFRKQLAIRKYERDVQAGRVKPTRVERCQDCTDQIMPCDACVQRHQAAHAA